MRITIAISAKNADKIIGECLESIWLQSDKPDEIFVIVDDSDDPTIKVAASMGARVLVNEGAKLYDARNTALKHCNTDILAFTDADCILDKDWVRNVKRVFHEHPEVGGGTGRHPPIGKHSFSSWLHHMWYIVETEKTGYTNGVIGGNCYFRTKALREVGGWPSLPIMAAEDVCISKKLIDAGYKLWFSEEIKAYHKYRTSFKGLWRQTVIMGNDIVVMMKATGYRDYMFWYTLAIPIVAVLGVVAPLLIFVLKTVGIMITASVYIGSLVYLWYKFNSLRKAFPRWLARWVLIWPYSIGVIKGVFSS